MELPRDKKRLKAIGRSYALTVIKTLRKSYPSAKCALTHSNPLQLLVATILSAQCTDKRVNMVTPSLFKKYKTASDFANADPSVFEQEIRSTGFYRNKTKNIIAAGKVLSTQFHSKVPSTMEELLELPGVARKTANVVLGNAFGKNYGIAVDTHVMRVSFRLGLTNERKPEKIEKELMAVVPRKQWALFSNLIITHGRQVCFAAKPSCERCPLRKSCPSSLV